MAGCKRLEIILTNPQVLYFPGQTIQGQLQIDATSDIRTRAIIVHCHGEGHVEWIENSGDSSTTYESSDTYLDTQLTVYAKGGNYRAVLGEGNHVFPFQFVLPSGGLPGSFEGMKNCYVRYWLTGLINDTWTSGDQWSGDRECKTRFNVGGVVDLNTTLGANTPIELSDSQTVCCCCCESEPITASFRMDKTGYAPGEAVVCDAEITDGTGRGTNFTQIRLMQRVTYYTHKGRKHREQQECAQLQRGAIQPGGSDVFCGERLHIPPLPPSHLPGCRMIDIEYMVKMTVSMADSLSNLSLAGDIIIGTIPLQSALQNRPPRRHMDACLGLDRTQAGTPQTGPPVVQMGTPGNYDIPPPSYQECLIGRTGEADTTKDAGASAPYYAYYDCINPPDSATIPKDSQQQQNPEQNTTDQISANAQL